MKPSYLFAVICLVALLQACSRGPVAKVRTIMPGIIDGMILRDAGHLWVWSTGKLYEVDISNNEHHLIHDFSPLEIAGVAVIDGTSAFVGAANVSIIGGESKIYKVFIPNGIDPVWSSAEHITALHFLDGRLTATTRRLERGENPGMLNSIWSVDGERSKMKAKNGRIRRRTKLGGPLTFYERVPEQRAARSEVLREFHLI